MGRLRPGAWLAALALAAAGPGPATAQDPLVVAVETATVRDTSTRMSLTGEATAHQSLTVSFPGGGRVAEVLVDNGDQVEPGATLARIESVQQQQALRAAEAGLATARANLAKAQEDARRQDALLDRGATTRTARDAAADDLAASEAREAQAQAELDRARETLGDTVLTAPDAATVIDRMAEPGQVVGAAQPILELAIGETLDAVFDVPEAVLTMNSTHIPEVTIAGIDRPDVTVTAQVSDISPLIDQATGTVEVTVTLDAPLPGVSYGDAVRGTVELPGEPHVVLPWSAMSATAEGPAVWVLDDADRAHLRPVEVARYETGIIVLAGGVEAGERVVTLGAQLLYEGRLVRAAEATE